MNTVNVARRFGYDWARWGFRAAWSNLRFELGYKIGGFRRASR